MFRKRHTPGAAAKPAPTSGAGTPRQSLVRTRPDAETVRPSEIVTVLESRLQSPFG